MKSKSQKPSDGSKYFLNFLFALKGANLRTFKEFKFIHRRIATNTLLSETGIEDKEMCSFCQKKSGNTVTSSLSWDCRIVLVSIYIDY